MQFTLKIERWNPETEQGGLLLGVLQRFLVYGGGYSARRYVHHVYLVRG